MEGEDERSLVGRAARHDLDAWQALVQAHQEPVFRLAYLFCGDAGEAEDIAQETFLRAFSHLHQFDPTRPLRPWVLSIAANLSRNQRRSVGRYLAALQRFARALPQPGLRSVEERSAEHNDAQVLWNLVRRLNPEQQQLIYLRYYLDMSTAEVAESLSIPAGTVKSRLHRVLIRLKALIKQEDSELAGLTLPEEDETEMPGDL